MESCSAYPIIAVVGPTGTGKSDLAIHLARSLGGEILNCDSVQVYCGLDIGSAKTPPAARGGVPHHLIDVMSPDAELTAGEYARRARAVLQDLRTRAVLPVLAGGTGFYLRALLEGLSPAPGRDQELRTRLGVLARRRPLALHRFLRRRDPSAAVRIHPNDHQKLIRAIEIAALAPQTLPRQPLTGFRVLKLALDPGRPALYERLNLRCAAMFSNGLLEETRRLLDSGLPVTARPLQSLGYKQALQVIQGGLPLDRAITGCQIKTRQYAKRQMTWFRAERGIEWLNGFGADPVIQADALARARAFLHVN